MQLLLDLVLETLLPARSLSPNSSILIANIRLRLRRQRLVRVGLTLHQTICLLARAGLRGVEVAPVGGEAGALGCGVCAEVGAAWVRDRGVGGVLGVGYSGGGGGGGGREERIGGALVGQVCGAGLARGVFEGGRR